MTPALTLGPAWLCVSSVLRKPYLSGKLKVLSSQPCSVSKLRDILLVQANTGLRDTPILD